MRSIKKLIFSIVIILQMFLLTTSVFEKKDETGRLEGEIIVLFDEKLTDAEVEGYAERLREKVEVTVSNHIEDYALFTLENDADVTLAKKMLQRMEGVSIVDDNYEINAFSITNDTYIDSQWAVNNNGSYQHITKNSSTKRNVTEDVDIDAYEAWAIANYEGYSSHEVIVAIIDTGIDYQHPEIKDSMWINEDEIEGDGIDNDGNGYIDDYYGWDFYNKDNTICHYQYDDETGEYRSSPRDLDDHGTHIAGIIAAKSNNHIGIAGVASNVKVKLMSLKINGGVGTTGSIASAIEAIKYATAQGAKICNISWGVSKYHEAFERVIKESNMLFVCAAGNSGTNNDNYPIYPASFDLENVISVTYVNAKGALVRLSNYGRKTVDIAAPGEDIYSTVVGSYASMSGSSMAAPHVTAVAAMLYAYKSNVYPSTVKKVLISSSKELKELDGYIKNPMIISASRALFEMDKLDKDITKPEIKIETKFEKDKIKVIVKSSDKGGAGVRVIKWMVGRKGKSKFKNGTVGTSVTENEFYISKTGYYTFYISDYAGNDTTLIYEVKDDVTAPSLSADYTVANNYKSMQITVKASDKESGIRQIKYLDGEYKVNDFLSQGTEVKLVDGIATIKVLKEGTYTIYALDYRGNKSIITVPVSIVKSSGLTVFGTRKEMSVGDRYKIRALLYPIDSTDQISYITSNPKIASVSTTGLLIAKEPGEVTITVKTSSGQKVMIKFNVIK